MNAHKYTSRLLGAAFLFVILTSLSCGLLVMSVAGSGSVSDVLVNVSKNPALLRIAIVDGMLNSTGIVVLAALLYIVLHKQNKIMALAALASWLGEAMFYAISMLGALALIPLSQDFVAAGAPAGSFYQTLGDFLYNGIYNHGSTMLMWFYCTGGLMWYYMFYRSKYIPRAISLFGILAVILGLAAVVFQQVGYDIPILVSLPILPFELTIGTWLLFRGIKEQPLAAGTVQGTVTSG